MNTTKLSASSMKIIVAAAAVVALLLAAAILFFTNQSVINEGNKKQADVSASYSNAAVYLSNCVVKTKQTAGLLKSQTAGIDQIITNGVAARYGEGNTMDSAKLFSAIQEAYPDKSAEALSKTYNSALQIITGCQDDFANKQTVVLDKVRMFDSWLNGSTKVRYFGGSGFPNENLRVSLPGLNLTGLAALDKIRMPIVDNETSETYQTGEQSLDDPFAEK